MDLPSGASSIEVGISCLWSGSVYTLLLDEIDVTGVIVSRPLEVSEILAVHATLILL